MGKNGENDYSYEVHEDGDDDLEEEDTGEGEGTGEDARTPMEKWEAGEDKMLKQALADAERERDILASQNNMEGVAQMDDTIQRIRTYL